MRSSVNSLLKFLLLLLLLLYHAKAAILERMSFLFVISSIIEESSFDGRLAVQILLFQRGHLLLSSRDG